MGAWNPQAPRAWLLQRHPDPDRTPITRAQVAAGLLEAWADLRRSGRRVPANPALTWPEIYLARHPREYAAVTDRERALQSDYSLALWLANMGGRHRAPSTHARDWRRGCQIIADGLNEAAPL